MVTEEEAQVQQLAVMETLEQRSRPAKKSIEDAVVTEHIELESIRDDKRKRSRFQKIQLAIVISSRTS